MAFDSLLEIYSCDPDGSRTIVVTVTDINHRINADSLANYLEIIGGQEVKGVFIPSPNVDIALAVYENTISDNTILAWHERAYGREFEGTTPILTLLGPPQGVYLELTESEITEEFLGLYFENTKKSGGVEGTVKETRITCTPSDGIRHAVVQIKSTDAIHTILNKRDHQLKGRLVQLQPYYPEVHELIIRASPDTEISRLSREVKEHVLQKEQPVGRCLPLGNSDPTFRRPPLANVSSVVPSVDKSAVLRTGPSPGLTEASKLILTPRLAPSVNKNSSVPIGQLKTLNTSDTSSPASSRNNSSSVMQKSDSSDGLKPERREFLPLAPFSQNDAPALGKSGATSWSQQPPVNAVKPFQRQTSNSSNEEEDGHNEYKYKGPNMEELSHTKSVKIIAFLKDNVPKKRAEVTLEGAKARCFQKCLESRIRQEAKRRDGVIDIKEVCHSPLKLTIIVEGEETLIADISKAVQNIWHESLEFDKISSKDEDKWLMLRGLSSQVGKQFFQNFEGSHQCFVEVSEKGQFFLKRPRVTVEDIASERDEGAVEKHSPRVDNQVEDTDVLESWRGGDDQQKGETEMHDYKVMQEKQEAEEQFRRKQRELLQGGMSEKQAMEQAIAASLLDQAVCADRVIFEDTVGDGDEDASERYRPRSYSPGAGAEVLDPCRVGWDEHEEKTEWFITDVDDDQVLQGKLRGNKNVRRQQKKLLQRDMNEEEAIKLAVAASLQEPNVDTNSCDEPTICYSRSYDWEPPWSCRRFDEDSVSDKSPELFSGKKIILGHTEVVLKKGVLVKETADVLVNIVSPSGKLTETTVGKSFVSCGGEDLEKIYDKAVSDAEDPGTLVITNAPGRLKCKSVFHVKLQAGNNDCRKAISHVMQDILTECLNRGYSTLALPPLGVGRMYRYPAEEVAEQILRAVSVQNQVRGRYRHNLRKVTVVIFKNDEEIFKKFESVFANFTPSGEARVGSASTQNEGPDPTRLLFNLMPLPQQRTDPQAPTHGFTNRQSNRSPVPLRNVQSAPGHLNSQPAAHLARRIHHYKQHEGTSSSQRPHSGQRGGSAYHKRRKDKAEMDMPDICFVSALTEDFD